MAPDIRGVAMTFDAATSSDQLGAVRHAAGRVYCPERGGAALVSVIERADVPTVRFVLWCSLRACSECSERCLPMASCDLRGS